MANRECLECQVGCLVDLQAPPVGCSQVAQEHLVHLECQQDLLRRAVVAVEKSQKQEARMATGAVARQMTMTHRPLHHHRHLHRHLVVVAVVVAPAALRVVCSPVALAVCSLVECLVVQVRTKVEQTATAPK